MKQTNMIRISLLLWLASSVLAVTPGNSETAFQTFESLQGTWSIESGGKTLPIKMSYEIGSKGSAVVEEFGTELTVIYRDGARLLLTHFCNAGNVPRLRLKESLEPGVLEFEMVDIANLKSADAAHVEKIIYRVLSNQKLSLEIVWRRGSMQESENYKLTKL